MKILVIGCGLQGLEIARDLARDTAVGVCDVSEAKLAECRRLGIRDVHKLDAANRAALTALVKKYDVIVGAIPGRMGFELVKQVILAQRDMVDICFMPENILKLHPLAKQYGVKVIPDCGLAPGISNLLVGHSVSLLKNVRSVYIAVGGLPQHPTPPLNYRTVFSLEDVLEEYTRPVNFIRKERLVQADPMTALEPITFPGVGTLECFNTDGLRTLRYTIKGVPEMVEKTIRYPGHAREIQTLIDAGLLETKPIPFRGQTIRPRDVILSLLGPKLVLGKGKDVTVLRVVVKGQKTYKYELVDYYTKGVTSMARTTGYPCAIVARLVKRIKGTGVIPPEKLGQDPVLFKTILAELSRRGIKIKESIS